MNKTDTRTREKSYTLFGGKTTDNKSKALNERETFALNFADMWDEGDSDTRIAMIRYAAELSPEQGLELVLFGMADYTRQVKLETKKALKKLAARVTVRQDKIISRTPAIRSELFARRLYKEMSHTLSIDEVSTYVAILLEIGGRGPFFAWKYFIKDVLPVNIFIEMLNKLPEKLRLRFIRYYFKSSISDKRTRANAVRAILKQIKELKNAERFIESIIDSTPECHHSALALSGTILTEFMARLDIPALILKTSMDGADDKTKITRLKIAGIMNRPDVLYRYLPFVDTNETQNVRLTCIDILGKSHNSNDLRIIRTLTALLNDADISIVLAAFNALIELDVKEIVTIARQLIHDKTAFRIKIYNYLGLMKAESIIAVLEDLPEPFSTDARRTVGKQLIRSNPDRLEVLLEYHKNSNDPLVKQAAAILNEKISRIKLAGYDHVKEKFKPEPYIISPGMKRFLKSKTPAKQTRVLNQLSGRDPETEISLKNDFFSEIKINGLNVENVNFSGSVFLNSDFQMLHLKNVRLNKARFESISFRNAVFENVVFDNSIFINTDAHAAHFINCSFAGASIADSSFEFAEMAETCFAGSTLIDCNFSKSDLSFASFTGAQLYMNTFKYASLFQAELIYTRGILCDFTETDLTKNATIEHSNLNTPLKGWNSIEIPSAFYEKELLETRWLNILVLTNEMDCQRDIFLQYNTRRKECALDAFKPEQEDLFEIIPLLIHLSQHLIPVERKETNNELYENSSLKNMSAGIYGYIPTLKSVRLAKKHLNCDKLLLLPGKKNNIEAVYTMGSLGTIAQSSDSDIDFWVCVNKNTMDNDAVTLLKLKLEAIERWAKARFATELHFFVVDAQSIREGHFGGSDFESSGSAQGMILKEEFYRTMILIAGKIPFWCVLPVWAEARYYNLMFLIANRFHEDYLDFGNVSLIPAGEYFGASMWQLFKSLKSPYKSVMKMGLLEKYLQEKEESGLLCNRLKRRWASGKCDLRHQDPYLMLFEDIYGFYTNDQQENDIRPLVQICFFFKLGIRSMKDLDRAVLQIRKVLIQRCIANFAWSETMLCELGCFSDWSYTKIKQFSDSINHFMLETYRKLSASLNNVSESKAVITNRDIAILGRKMFVHFVPQPNKVSQLPHLGNSTTLFRQIYIYYRQRPKKTPLWEGYLHYNKKELSLGNSTSIINGMTHIEEIAAWIIRNRLIKAGTTFNILPNPTPVSAQDFNELTHEMNQFFEADDEAPVSSTDFLQDYQVKSLYLIINFNSNRKDNRIFSSVAVYTTTWGDFFCKVFSSKNGHDSMSDIIALISRDLGLSLNETRIGYYIPKMSRKRIKKV